MAELYLLWEALQFRNVYVAIIAMVWDPVHSQLATVKQLSHRNKLESNPQSGDSESI